MRVLSFVFISLSSAIAFYFISDYIHTFMEYVRSWSLILLACGGILVVPIVLFLPGLIPVFIGTLFTGRNRRKEKNLYSAIKMDFAFLAILAFTFFPNKIELAAICAATCFSIGAMEKNIEKELIKNIWDKEDDD